MHTHATTAEQTEPTDTTPIENQNSKIENPPSPFLSPAALTLLLGDPGTGKSLLSLDLAARLTRGLPAFPNSEFTDSLILNSPQSTLLLSTEDSEQTIRSRAEAANANLTLLLNLPSTLTLVPPKKLFCESQEPASLLAALDFVLPKLEKAKKPAKLLILDPLPAFLGTYDCTHAASIRRLLSPLLQLAQQHNFSILGITHLNKAPQSRTKATNPLHRALNSIAYVALARSVLLLTHDDQTHDPNRRFLIPLKSNLTPRTHALAFQITNTPNPTQRPSPQATRANVPTSSEGTIPSAPATPPIENRNSKIENPPTSTAHIQWEQTPITDHPLLTNTPTPPSDPLLRSQLDLAEDFLRTTLADGPLPSAEILKQSRTLALSQRTLERARHQLNISVYRDPTSKQWLMSL